MYKRSEGFFKGYQDINLFFQIWEKPQAQGTIIITHGHGEHSESYARLIEGFDDQNWTFYAWDLRGHGRSEGRRGYAKNFDDYCQDFKIFIEKVQSQEQVKKGPVILLCHSMGALIELKSLMLFPELRADALVVSSPLLGIAVHVPALKAQAAKILKRYLPQVTLGNELDNLMLTRDLDVVREFEQDALRHNRLSSAVFLGFLESFAFVTPRAEEIKTPAIFLISDSDAVISSKAARNFYEHLGSEKKEIFIYPGAKHELFNDIIRQTVYADLKKFLAPFLESHQ